MAITEATLMTIITIGSILISGLGGALIGAWLAPKANHKYSMQRLKEEHSNKINYLKEEIFFKKKLEFLDNLSIELGFYGLCYTRIKAIIEKNPELDRALKNGGIIINKKDRLNQIKKEFKRLREREIGDMAPIGKSIYFSRDDFTIPIAQFMSRCTQIFMMILKYTQKGIDQKEENTLRNLLETNIQESMKLLEKIKKEMAIQ